MVWLWQKLQCKVDGMASKKRQRLDDQLVVPQIIVHAKHRWLRPAEICEILRNHTSFCLSELADKPESGSLFLYDREVLRSFRKDGYRWKKTKDGKAVKEAHERLKVGGVEVLHCYYAHGEENENFQRRCYWMIEQHLSQIVLVHYREIKGSKGYLSCSSKLFINRNMHSDTACISFSKGFDEDESLNCLLPPRHMELDEQNDSSLRRHPDKEIDHRILKNLDHTDQCMNAELRDLTEPQMSTYGDYLNTIASENGIDGLSARQPVELATLGPSLFKDLLFNIIDLSPNWAYENSKTKVVVVGRFLKSQELESFKWSCMFGEVEVPAEVVADGVLRCYTPIHRAARIPFYVSCSNRLACSEGRIFEYRVNQTQEADFKDDGCKDNTLLVMRFGKLLSPTFKYPIFNPKVKYRQYDPICVAENSDLTRKINSLLKDGNEERAEMLKHFPDEFSLDIVKEQLVQQFLKDKFHEWLLQQLAVGGNGFRVLDEGGQGVLHIGAALGYDWVLSPMKMAGVSVDFRDGSGWTALHWAAFCGRERAVALLIGLGAAPGALTDPCTKNPTGKTPADLASAKGYKGIAGYLAESSLSAHLQSLKLEKSVQPVPEQYSTSSSDGDVADALSMSVCLTALCNATQAAALIHQLIDVQSFHWKQLKEYGDKLKTSDEGTLSPSAVKSHTKCDEHVRSEEIQISEDFLISRTLQIQAHVRDQVRTNCRNIVWAVGILEKIILRWRRKGTGLRGFSSELLSEGPCIQVSSSKAHDYDFLKEGRKQTEERLQSAVARVKSMVQYREARDQYHQLLNIFTEIQETKVNKNLTSSPPYKA